ncbi:transmembrane protein 234 isoform X2 [Acanthopagrus latus]|uniref:transmembrane protein 234 isoform X2 n=1 Tax=Acanthopagrus latus TaxID=8177 RepID=UPI00187CFFA7|nr:transmembrane protein 234 isoform X2 [Acanthopagrus latus]
MGSYLGELLSLLLVSVLWGCTNPLLKRGTEGIEHVTETSRVSQILAELKFLFLNLKYLVPFLLNQSGSLVYYYTLSTTGETHNPKSTSSLSDGSFCRDLSLAVPVANSLTFLCTVLTGKALGEEFGGKQAVAGMFLTMAGITLCIISSVDDKDAGKQDMTQAVH